MSPGNPGPLLYPDQQRTSKRAQDLLRKAGVLVRDARRQAPIGSEDDEDIRFLWSEANEIIKGLLVNLKAFSLVDTAPDSGSMKETPETLGTDDNENEQEI